MVNNPASPCLPFPSALSSSVLIVPYIVLSNFSLILVDTSDDNNNDNDNSDNENNRDEIEWCKHNSDTNQESTDNESDDEYGHCFLCNKTGITGLLCHCREDSGACFL